MSNSNAMWLEQLSLADYVAVFAENDIDCAY
jgi:hypothetical protein